MADTGCAVSGFTVQQIRLLFNAALFSSAACLLMALPANAQQYKNLSGEYSISGQTIIDPPPNEPTDTHMYFALTGSAARDLYNAMKVAAKADACGEPGGLLKSIGAMQCTRAAGGKTYQCGFAIDIARQRISGGSAC